MTMMSSIPTSTVRLLDSYTSEVR